MKPEDIISQWGMKLVLLIIVGVLYFLFVQSNFSLQLDILIFSAITIVILFGGKLLGMATSGMGAESEEKEAEVLPKDRLKRMVIQELGNRRNNWLKDHILTPIIYGYNRTGMMKVSGPFENGYVPINPSKQAKVNIKGDIMSYFECVDLIKNNDLEQTAQKFSPTKKKEAYSEYDPESEARRTLKTIGGT